MKTFFEHVEERGQAAVCRELDMRKATVSRAARCQVDISHDLIDRCEATWGAEFDRDGTLRVWFERRRLVRQAHDGDHAPDAEPVPTQEQRPVVESQDTAA